MDPRQLREETRPEHEATEAVMPLMQPGLTLEVYSSTLRALFPILRGWEIWAAKNAPPAMAQLLPPRRRSHLLEQDLAVLGGSAGKRLDAENEGVNWDEVVKARGAETPSRRPEAFKAAFLGAFYVLEGSTLGGRFLARHAETRLGLRPGHGNAYFLGHGEATGALWRETLDFIAAVPEADAPLVIAAAKRTFGAFGAILQRSLSALPAQKPFG